MLHIKVNPASVRQYKREHPHMSPADIGKAIINGQDSLFDTINIGDHKKINFWELGRQAESVSCNYNAQRPFMISIRRDGSISAPANRQYQKRTQEMRRYLSIFSAFLFCRISSNFLASRRILNSYSIMAKGVCPYFVQDRHGSIFHIGARLAYQKSTQVNSEQNRAIPIFVPYLAPFDLFYPAPFNPILALQD